MASINPQSTWRQRLANHPLAGGLFRPLYRILALPRRFYRLYDDFYALRKRLKAYEGIQVALAQLNAQQSQLQTTLQVQLEAQKTTLQDVMQRYMQENNHTPALVAAVQRQMSDMQIVSGAQNAYLLHQIQNLSESVSDIREVAATAVELTSRLTASEKALHYLQEQADQEQVSSHEQSAVLNNAIADLTARVTQLDKMQERIDLPDFLPTMVNLPPYALEKYVGHDQLDVFYEVLEDEFRGSEALIRERQERYLPYLHVDAANSDLPIADIGCGRGEFLRLARDHKLPVVGVDINAMQIARLAEQGFSTVHAGGLEYLETIKPNSLAGIVSFQVVEHISHEYLQNMIRLAYDRLATGGFILLETVNPYCLDVYRVYYLDPTHRNPVPLDLLSLVMRFNQFHISHSFLYAVDATEPGTALDQPAWHYQGYALLGVKK